MLLMRSKQEGETQQKSNDMDIENNCGLFPVDINTTDVYVARS